MLSAVERGIPRREVAQLFGISLATISRYVKLKASGRQIAPKPSPGRRAKIMGSSHERAIRAEGSNGSSKKPGLSLCSCRPTHRTSTP